MVPRSKSVLAGVEGLFDVEGTFMFQVFESIWAPRITSTLTTSPWVKFSKSTSF